MRNASLWRLGSFFGALSLISGIIGVSAVTAPAASGVVTSTAVHAAVSDTSLLKVGTTNVRALHGGSSSSGRFLQGPEGNLPRTGGSGPTSTIAVSNKSISTVPTALLSGFPGITGKQQATANAAYDLEPPDQGLCSNGTDVVEIVNNAYAVYSTSGATIAGPIATTALFGIPPEQPNGAGSFVSDPRCYFDAQTGRWFVTELSIPNFFAPHKHATKSYELIAVSQTSDPTGNFTTFAIDSTDQSDPGCPCFGDYPMIGADANGFYVSTNEFSIYKSSFNGAQVYAISKTELVSAANGGPTPVVVHIGALPSPFPAEGVGETYHLSPALTPADGTYASGTEYFTMSDAFPVSSDLLAVYALTNTSSLASTTPSVSLSSSLVTLGQYYQFPETGVAVTQKAASLSSQTPLLNYIESQTGATVPEGVLQADFDAVEETTYSNGKLFTELSNSSTPTNAVGTTSAEWFILTPSIGSSGVTATLTHEGNLGVTGSRGQVQSLLYPDIVVNGSGVGDMVFTLTGSQNFPSAAYIPFGSSGPTGSVNVAGAGSGPEDGFTCYAYYVGPSFGGCRWGDYSGGVAVGSTVWMATEYVPPNTGATARDFFTNWGTFIFSSTAGG